MNEKGKAKLNTIVRLGLLLGLALLVFACATKSEAWIGMDTAVAEGNFEKAIDLMRIGQEPKKQKDRIYRDSNLISLYLDKGFLEFYVGNNKNSSEDLQEAERRIEEAFTKSVSGEFATMIANDNSREYAGEDFEDIYLNVFNALNYYKQDNVEGALVEIRKLTQGGGKLQVLSTKYESSRKSSADRFMENMEKIGFKLTDALPKPDENTVKFNNSALAQFLGGLFYLADGNEDSARICFDDAVAAYAGQPNVYTTPVPKAFAEVKEVPEGLARLNILAFSGLSPVKEEGEFTQNWPFMANPELRNPIFRLPVFRGRSTSASAGTTRIHVSVGENEFELDLLEDMGAVVQETYKAKANSVFFKTWIRVMLKYTVSDIAATVASRTQAGELGRLAAANSARAAINASERADIRMGRYLPDEAYIGGVNLEPGSYTATITFSGSGTKYEIPVDVKADGVNLIDVACLK